MKTNAERSGLPVSLSVTPEGVQGTGQREGTIEHLIGITGLFLDRWAPQDPKARAQFWTDLKLLTAYWGGASEEYINWMHTRAAVQSLENQQAPNTDAQGGQS